VTFADRLLQSVVTTGRAAFQAAACSVAALDPTGASLVFQAADGGGAAEVVGLSIPVSSGIAGWAVVSGQAIAVADVAADPRFDAATAERTGYVPRVILAAPVISGGDAVGVIEVLDPKADADLDLLGRFAEQAALALAAPDADDPAAPALGPAEQALVQAALDYARQRGR
jgi:GAF domain-containing protein